MKRSIKPATKAQRAHQARQREFGCICCHIEGDANVPAEIHHINDCGRNMGQDYTLPLCDFHHRGIIPDSRIYRGPSLADGKKPFVAHYGTELELLERVNSEIACDSMKSEAQKMGLY